VADEARDGGRNGDRGGGKIVVRDPRSRPVMTTMKEDKKMTVLQNSNSDAIWGWEVQNTKLREVLLTAGRIWMWVSQSQNEMVNATKMQSD